MAGLRGVRGSSPLTRGKRPGTTGTTSTLRLIPAHAGKTARSLGSRACRAAHPRSRGENLKQIARDVNKSGSSPLTRGKQAVEGEALVCERLIPAHAGKTWSSRKVARPIRAHPRSRGENLTDCQMFATLSGSSPLTRGKHFLTCAFTAQIDQILETLELAASFGSYLIWVACATDAPQDPVRSIGLVLPSSMGAS